MLWRRQHGRSASQRQCLRGIPSLPRQGPRLDYMWYRPTIAGAPQDRFATISDDGVRVWVDGRLVIDSWAPHKSKADAAALGGGGTRFVWNTTAPCRESVSEDAFQPLD